MALDSWVDRGVDEWISAGDVAASASPAAENPTLAGTAQFFFLAAPGW